MQYRKKLIRGLIIVVSILIVLSGMVLIYGKKVPVESLEKARAEISKAKKTRVPQYAGETLKMAESQYDSAMLFWKSENEKLLVLRDFTRVKKHADEASRLAILSVEESKSASAQIKTLSTNRINAVQEQYDKFQASYSRIPLTRDQMKTLFNGELLLKEGIVAHRKGDFYRAIERANGAGSAMDEVTRSLMSAIEGYFRNSGTWVKWADSSVQNSLRNKTVTLVIDKYDRVCLLYDKGRLTGIFPVEISPNWMGDKNLQGDRATPEGVYRITTMKMRSETRFYKALLLNYPNDDDKRRFQANQQRGVYGRGDKIGNLIEIHGHGGKGADWTDGCIALENEDMDILFRYCKPGTEVVIVGSLRSMEQIMNN